MQITAYRRFPITLLALALCLLAAPAFPATFDVNSTLDATDCNPGDGIAETAPGNGTCTLRAAIREKGGQ